MSVDPGWLFLSLVVGGVGFVLFAYGKKQERWPHLVAGLALMVYPNFVSSIGALAGVGVALCVGLWPAVRNGWQLQVLRSRSYRKRRRSSLPPEHPARNRGARHEHRRQ